MCSNLLQDEARREDDGTGARGGVTGGANQSAVTMRESERLYDLILTAKIKARKKEREQHIAGTTQNAVKTTVAKLTPLFPNVKPEESKWH